MAYSHSHWPHSSGSYFGGAQISPTDPELVFVQGVSPWRSRNGGWSWTDISGNLPDAPVNDVIIDPFQQNRLYVGTDVGVFKTNDLGAHWTAYGSGMPINVVTDLDYHPPTRTLVAGTYGRSIFKTTTGLQKRRAPRRVRPGG